MKNTFIKNSGTLDDLRKSTLRITNSCYHDEFLDENRSSMLGISGSKLKCRRAFITEYIEVTKDNNDNIIWNKVEKIKYKRENTLNTDFGVFKSVDDGEFGGKLTLPNGKTIYGNYNKLFKVNNKVYAIESLSHLGLAEVRILLFDKNLDYTELYKSNPKDYIKCYIAKTDTDEIYIILTGLIISSEEQMKPETQLLKATESGLENIARFNKSFEYTYNMIINDNKIYLGMNKAVSILDIQNTSVEVYTPLTIEAEKNLLSN